MKRATCKLPLNEWHVVGMRVYNTTSPATARIDMLVDGVMVASWIDITPGAAGAFGLATWAGGASFDDVTFNALPATNGIQFRAYYAFGAAQLAVRQRGGAAVGSNVANLAYLHGDHLGSVSAVTAGSDGSPIGTRLYYMPFGDVRGTPATGLPTDRRYTGEMRTPNMELYQFGARWYSPSLSRWTQPDTIIPDSQDPQSLNRYSYTRNNSLRYIDPTGHRECEDSETCNNPPPPDPIPGCDELCDDMTPAEREAYERAFRHFLKDPAYFAALWADNNVWYSNDEALNLRWYAEMYLHMAGDQLVLNGISAAYGDDTAKQLETLRRRNEFEQAGMSKEQLDQQFPVQSMSLVLWLVSDRASVYAVLSFGDVTAGASAPGPFWIWKGAPGSEAGGPEGNWVYVTADRSLTVSLRPELGPGSAGYVIHGSHWDLTIRNVGNWRIYPDIVDP